MWKNVLSVSVSTSALIFVAFLLRNERLGGRVSEQLLGSWSLISRQTTVLNGQVLADPWLSTTPSGILIYDRSGHVAAQLSRPDRTIEMLADECSQAENQRNQ